MSKETSLTPVDALALMDASGQEDYSFEEHFRSNDGALLELLASTGPLEEVDARIINGVSSLSRRFVHRFIEGYASAEDGGEEREILKKRFRSVRWFGSHALGTNLDTLCPEEDIDKVSGKTPKHGTKNLGYQELAQGMIFDEGGELRIDQIPRLISKRPGDPALIYVIADVLEEKGIDLQVEEPLQSEIRKAMDEAYSRNLFRGRRIDIDVASKILEKWVGYVESGSNVGGSGFVIHMTYISALLRGTLANLTKAQEFNKVMHGLKNGLESQVKDPRCDANKTVVMCTWINDILERGIGEMPKHVKEHFGRSGFGSLRTARIVIDYERTVRSA